MADPATGGVDWEGGEDLSEFLGRSTKLSRDDGLTIILRADMMLRGYYVHLPEKQRIYSIDPLAELDRLSGELPADDVGPLLHERLCGIFAELRDLHTQYTLPEPYQSHVCLLPFKLEMYRERGRPRYIVTDVQASLRLPAARASFEVGVEILSWCGVDIDSAVTAAAGLSGAASCAARRARALAAMTIRPMLRLPPPQAPLVTLTYRTLDGDERDEAFPWRVVPVELETTDPALAHFISGMDHEGAARQRAYTSAYHPRVLDAVRQAAAGARVAPYPDKPTLPTKYPALFKAHALGDSGFGYIRIFSFAAPTHLPIAALIDDVVAEFASLLAQLPKAGLVIDVRGNSGGCLPLAEALLQVLVPGRITPEPLEMRATSEVLALTTMPSNFAEFHESVVQAMAAGGTYSGGFPMTLPAWLIGITQSYAGPVVLIVDALCYSATDSFAAGFQDHAIGKVLGVAPSTGAGGANVWTLEQFLSMPGTELGPLPQKASLRVALRRTLRVGSHEGELIEGIGVQPDVIHEMTRADLLEGDRDLLARAAEILKRTRGG